MAATLAAPVCAPIGGMLNQVYLRPQLIQCFEQAAWVVGGTLTIQDGWGDNREIPTLAARIEGVPIEATIERSRVSQIFHTLVRAPARGPLGLSLGISPGAASSGAQTGDRSFDARFSVRANDERYAKLWLDEHVRRRLRDTQTFYSAQRFGFELADEKVVGRRKEYEQDPETLIRVLNATAALAARGHRLLDEWRALGNRLGGSVVADDAWRPDTKAHIDIRVGGARIVIDSVHGVIADAETRRCLITRVSCLRRSTEPDSFRLIARGPDNPIRPSLKRAKLHLTPEQTLLASSYDIRCENRERLIARLDDKTRAAILAVRPAAILAGPEQVSLLIPGFERGISKLEQSVALARKLAIEVELAGVVGPYR